MSCPGQVADPSPPSPAFRGPLAVGICYQGLVVPLGGGRRSSRPEGHHPEGTLRPGGLQDEVRIISKEVGHSASARKCRENEKLEEWGRREQVAI